MPHSIDTLDITREGIYRVTTELETEDGELFVYLQDERRRIGMRVLVADSPADALRGLEDLAAALEAARDAIEAAWPEAAPR